MVHSDRPKHSYLNPMPDSRMRSRHGFDTGKVNIGSGPRPRSQDGSSHLQEPVPLSLPHLNRLVEASFVWDEISASNADVTVIPSQFIKLALTTACGGYR